MPRTVHHRYDDPLELIWLACLRELGFQLQRSDEVYASFDGARTLTLSTREHFDADDSLAQLIFHELCHALVSGERGVRRADWGMENIDARDLEQEHACHRLQSALADEHGLRGLFAVTTEHRTYWDTLPIDPLGPGDDSAIPVARDAFERARKEPWRAALQGALRRTAALAASMRELPLPSDSLWRRTQPVHASGFPVSDEPGLTCGACAWSFARSGAAAATDGEAPRSCRQSVLRHGQANLRRRPVLVGAAARACVRFEPRLDQTSCEVCGACCREGFDRVEIGQREHKALRSERLRALLVVDGFGPHLPRPHGRCVALSPDDLPSARSYRCSIYAERPRACADFAVAGDACLTARRRVGLSP